MKLGDTGNARAFWGIYGALVVIALLLGLGNQGIISSLLSGGQEMVTGDLPGAGGHETGAGLRTRDSLIEAAEAGGRNPFAPPPQPPPPAVHRQPPRRSPPPEEPPPSLRALMFDTVNPSVQLRLGDTSSGWLHKGDVFEGWTVIEIAENSITVEKKGRTVLLDLRKESL